MNFDMLLEDGSHLQKTDSIWLPGNPRRHPVYKFEY